jgi:hypothetical protein
MASTRRNSGTVLERRAPLPLRRGEPSRATAHHRWPHGDARDPRRPSVRMRRRDMCPVVRVDTTPGRRPRVGAAGLGGRLYALQLSLPRPGTTGSSGAPGFVGWRLLAAGRLAKGARTMSNKLASKLRRAELRRSFRKHAPFCASAAEKGVGFSNMLHRVMRPVQEREMDHAAAWKLMQEARKRAAKTRKAHPGQQPAPGPKRRSPR